MSWRLKSAAFLQLIVYPFYQMFNNNQPILPFCLLKQNINFKLFKYLIVVTLVYSTRLEFIEVMEWPFGRPHWRDKRS